MALQLPGWSGDIERTFKEVLFRFLEDVHCTKAALYLLSPDGDYLLVTQYGFGRKDLVTAQYPPSTELPIRASKLEKGAEAINHPEESQGIYEILHSAGSNRMLLVPIRSGERLLGFVDARDKGRKLPFDEADERTATRIAAEFLQLIRMTGLVDVDPGEEMEAPEAHREAPSPQSSPKRRMEFSIFPGNRLLDPMGLSELCRSIESEMKSQSGLGFAVLSIVEGRKVSCRAFAAEGMTAEDLGPVFQHQFELLQSAGVGCQPTAEWDYYLESLEVPAPKRPLILGSRVLVEEKGWSLLFSLMGSADSGLLPGCMERIGSRLHQVSSGSWCRYSRFIHAREILESGQAEFDALFRHSMAVSEISWLLAHRMGLGYPGAEQAALAGLLHDVGMLELEDSGFYRRPSPGEAEIQEFRKHCERGEKMALRMGFGDIAPILRSHHERWDGQGYPDRRRASDIPMLSRIIHVAEVFDTLTSSTSYLQAISPEAALAKMETAAGAQFDPSVIGGLREII